MSLEQDVQQPAPGTLIDLYELDLTYAGFAVPVIRFYPGLDANYGELVFDTNTYAALALTITGFESSSDGPMPRPVMTISNVDGYMSSQMKLYNEFLGAKVTRIRTMAKYLDNGSNPDTTAVKYEIYFVEQKKSENNVSVQFELASAVDIMDKQLPGRLMVANTCAWRYKGVECGWPGTDPSKWYDATDDPVGSSGEDSCGKRLASCKLRWGDTAELPYGGFPAIGRTR